MINYFYSTLISILVAHGLVAADDDSPAAISDLSAVVSHLDALLQSSAPPDAEMAEQLVREHVALARLAQTTFGNYLENSLEDYDDLLPAPDFQRLVEHYHDRLLKAYQQRLSADFASQLQSPALQGLHFERLDLDGRRGRAEFRALVDDRSLKIHADLVPVNQTWKIAELTIAGRPISEHYLHLYQDLIDNNYSLPVLETALAKRDFIALDDFSATWDGHHPMDWGPWKEKDRQKPMLYWIESSGDQHYMTARDSSHSVIVGKFIHWNPRQYPIMSWCWQATALPPGGNEFLDDANDSAAGLYVIFSQNWLGIPKQLKYVWSSTLPEGTVGRRDKIFRPWFFVVESGPNNLGTWTFETVDLEQNHWDKLGSEPAERTIGLGLLTDANSTRSYAEAYYADLRVWTREALENKRITNHCGALPKQLTHTAYKSNAGSALGAEE